VLIRPIPAARRSQAATCFLIEAGNGEKHLFDIGTGSMSNIASLMVPYQYLDSLGMDSPELRLVQSAALGKVVQFPEVGGLHHHYERLAA
jgi:hypothetical protein